MPKKSDEEHTPLFTDRRTSRQPDAEPAANLDVAKLGRRLAMLKGMVATLEDTLAKNLGQDPPPRSAGEAVGAHLDEILADAAGPPVLDLLQAAVDMMNRLLEISPDFTLQLVLASIPVPDDIVAAAKENKVPFKLTPLPDGSHVTGVFGILNAYLLWIGCGRGIAAVCDVEKGKITAVKNFEPWGQPAINKDAPEEKDPEE